MKITVKQVERRLSEIEKLDPVYDLAVQLMNDGWTENDIVSATNSMRRVSDPLKVKLWGRFRDAIHDIHIPANERVV